MLSEDANEKSINLAITIGKLTTQEIKKALQHFLSQRNNLSNTIKPNNPTKPKSPAQAKETQKTPTQKYGRTTLNQFLNEKGIHSTLELDNPKLRLLNRTMKEHNVKFALAKDGKGKYTLFFKTDNIDNITKAYKRYVVKLRKHSRNNPTIKKALAEARKIAQTLNKQQSKEKNRSKGGLDR